MSAPSPRSRRPRPPSTAERWRRPGSGRHGPAHVLEILRGLDPFVLLAYRSGRGRGEVSVHQLVPDPRGGAAALFGIRAPVGSSVVGASFLGVERSTEDGAAGAEVRIDVTVGRGGVVRSTVRHAATGDPVRPMDDGGPTDGRVVDALHRVLGVPSPGGPPPLEELLTGLWMLQVAPLIDRTPPGRGPGWADVAALHPEAPAGTRRPGAVPASAESLAEATVALTAGESWERLRRSAAAGRFDAPELDPADAAWMDTTLFARWMVESFPPTDRVLGALRSRGAHGAADGIESVLRLLPPGAEVA